MLRKIIYIVFSLFTVFGGLTNTFAEENPAIPPESKPTETLAPAADVAKPVLPPAPASPSNAGKKSLPPNNTDEPSLPAEKPRTTVKLSPDVRILQQKQNKPTIPIELIQQFLIRPKIVTQEEIEESGYIVANANESLLATSGDKVYARGLERLPSENEFIVVRLGQAYRNPGEEEVLAYEAIYLADARLNDDSDPATLTLTRVSREVQTGDRLLALDDRVFNEDFSPHFPAPESVDGARIIAVVNGVTQVSQYQIVVINKGSDDGIEIGNVMVVNHGSRLIEDNVKQGEKIILPNQRAGTLLVFRPFDRVSYALIMKSNLPISIFDEVGIP
ncbi:MAG: hypothetical protein BWK79_00930 [Beggiatoa sp. IS2]|nr:MAG: hypothetical protein BWK79_00930 [Beggiatoa sp. IS2]